MELKRVVISAGLLVGLLSVTACTRTSATSASCAPRVHTVQVAPAKYKTYKVRVQTAPATYMRYQAYQPSCN